jgi:hypothetical protein
MGEIKEEEFLKNMAKTQEETLRKVAKDMTNIARFLKKTPYSEEDKFKTNLVQASFYIHANVLAVEAFNKMIEDKEKNPDKETNIVEYFMDIIIKWQDKQMRGEKDAD